MHAPFVFAVFYPESVHWLSLDSQPQPAGMFVPGGCPFVAPVGGSVAVEDRRLLTEPVIMDVHTKMAQ